MTTLGYETQGTAGWQGYLNNYHLTKWIAPTGGILTSLTCFIKTTASFKHEFCGLVCDSSFNVLATGTLFSFYNNSGAWRTSNFNNENFYAGTLWVGVGITQRSPALAYDAGDNQQSCRGTFSLGTSSLAAPTTYYDYKFSAYITYTISETLASNKAFGDNSKKMLLNGFI